MRDVRSSLQSLKIALCCLAFVPSLARSEQDTPQPNTPQPKDLTPLPKDAVARLGTLRFRQASSVTSLAFRTDGKGLLAGGGPEAVEVWSVPGGLPITKLKDRWVQRIETSGPRKTIVTGNAFGEVTFWNARTGKQVIADKKHDGAMTAMVVGSDEEVLYTADDTGAIFAWSLTWRERIHEFPAQGSEITALAISNNGKILFSASYDRTIRFWDAQTKKVVRTLAPGTQVKCLARSKDNILYAGGQDGQVRAYDATTGNQVAVWKAHDDVVMDLLLTSKGQVVSSGYDGTILVWDPKTKREVRRIKTSPQEASVMALSPDENYLATGGSSGVIRLWDLATGKEVVEKVGFYGAIKTVALSPDGKTLACCDGTAEIRIWDLKTNREKHRWELSSGSAVSLQFSPDGKTLGFVDEAGSVRTFNTTTGKPSEKLSAKIEASSCCFSPDGKTLFAACQFGVRQWDAETGKQQGTLKTTWPAQVVAISQDAKMIAAGGEKGIVVWDAKTKAKVRELSVGSRTAALAFSPSGVLVSGHYDGRIRTWNISTGKVRRELLGHEGAVYALGFSPTGLLLVSGGFDKRVILWELASGEYLNDRKGHKGPVYSLAVTPKGTTVYSGSEDTTILGWKLQRPVADEPLPEAQLRQRLSSLWRSLASEDPNTGYRTFEAFMAGRKTTVAFLKEELGLFPRATILQFLEDLGSEKYKVRARAMISIRKVGSTIRPLLEEHLETTKDLEVETRLRDLIQELDRPNSLTRAQERYRLLRIVSLLETEGTPDAITLLKRIVKSAAESQVIKAAELALLRSARRNEMEK